MAVSAKAQIFLQESEAGERAESNPTLGIDVPGFGEGTDYYVPTGSGIILLATLGGAYLMGKKKKQS